MACTSPGRCASPADLDGAGLDWTPATVPGTAAGAVGADGRDFDAQDWWFRTRFAAGDPAETELRLDGIATVSEVYLNGELVLESASMFASHRVDVARTGSGAENELVIVCRALTPLLARRRRPSARWRTRVVNAGNLRWYRTMMFGRSPGFAAGPAPVGPVAAGVIGRARPPGLAANPHARRGTRWDRDRHRTRARTPGMAMSCASETPTPRCATRPSWWCRMPRCGGPTPTAPPRCTRSRSSVAPRPSPATGSGSGPWAGPRTSPAMGSTSRSTASRCGCAARCGPRPTWCPWPPARPGCAPCSSASATPG